MQQRYIHINMSVLLQGYDDTKPMLGVHILHNVQVVILMLNTLCEAEGVSVFMFQTLTFDLYNIFYKKLNEALTLKLVIQSLHEV